MPQMNRGGKFIFGVSVIGRDGLVQLPPQAVEEYSIAAEGRVYLFTGSRSTGGFCVTRRGASAAVEAGAHSDRDAGAAELRGPGRALHSLQGGAPIAGPKYPRAAQSG